MVVVVCSVWITMTPHMHHAKWPGMDGNFCGGLLKSQLQKRLVFFNFFFFFIIIRGWHEEKGHHSHEDKLCPCRPQPERSTPDIAGVNGTKVNIYYYLFVSWSRHVSVCCLTMSILI